MRHTVAQVVISAYPDLRPFMENYQAIASLYATIRAAYNTSPYIDIELTAKTKELVYRNAMERRTST